MVAGAGARHSTLFPLPLSVQYSLHLASPGPIHLTFLTINNLLNNVGLTSHSIANTFTSCNWIKKLLFNLSLKSVTIFSCIVDLSKSSDSPDKNSLHLAISECEYWDQLQCQDGIETSSQSVMQQAGSP